MAIETDGIDALKKLNNISAGSEARIFIAGPSNRMFSELTSSLQSEICVAWIHFLKTKLEKALSLSCL